MLLSWRKCVSLGASWLGAKHFMASKGTLYSAASVGVSLTWVTLWDCETAFRAAAYKRVAFQVA